jgi:hypothetical protein
VDDHPLSYDIEQQGRAPVAAYRQGATHAQEMAEVAEIVGERTRGRRICDCLYAMLSPVEGLRCSDCPLRSGARAEP